MSTFVVLEGRHLAAKDPNGLSDPYCIIGTALGDDGEGTFATSSANVVSEIQYWTLNPTWNKAILKNPVEGSTLRIEVWDKDVDKEDDFMGYALYKIQSKEDKWLPLLPRNSKDSVSGEIHIQVTLNKAPTSTATSTQTATNIKETSVKADNLPELLVQTEIPKLSSVVDSTPGLLETLLSKIGNIAQDWLEISRALALPLPPPSETRGKSLVGLGKLCKGQWIDAFRYYNATQSKGDTSTTYAYTLCRLHSPLGNSPAALLCELQNLQPTLSSTSPTKTDSALRFIAFACVHEKCVSKSSGSQTHQLLAAAYSLSFLACPPHWKEHLGGKLEELAWSILRERCSELAPLFGVSTQPNIAPTGKQTLADKWRLRKSNSSTSTALDKLFDMVGMENIKQQFLEIYDQITLDKARKIDIAKKKYNAKFVGNPGTGKTTVASLYAAMLTELGVISGTTEKTSGVKLAEKGTSALKKPLCQLKQIGGLLFVDRVDVLDPVSNPQDRKVLEKLITYIDNAKYDRLIVVFAGTSKAVDKLFAAKDGLASRFSFSFEFSDFTDEQLSSIYLSLVKAEGFAFANDDPKYVRVMARRIGKKRSTSGFCNAWLVKTAFQEALRRQASRLAARFQEGDLSSGMMRVLEREDILGAKPGDFRETCAAWKELDGMVGLGKVKSAVLGLFALVQNNLDQEEEELPMQRIALNKLFLGNPGTGKTVVAHLYGRILKDLGLLSKGDVKLHKASEFVGAVVGGSEETTRHILRSSQGCVLVIDEAYGLFVGKQAFADDARASAVINTLVEEIHNIPGEDRCVIMLGYEGEMREMILKSNPGLARRFQLENAFIFEDYNNYELLQILDICIAKEGIQTNQEARVAALNVLERQRNQLNFGNGGAVTNLLSQAILNMSARTMDQQRAQELLPIDFDPSYGSAPQDEDAFEGLIGCDNIIQVMHEYRATIKMGLEKGLEPFKNDKLELNFLFVGPAGTGKTTVARRMGKMFKSLGVLNSDEVTAISASDLETGFVGQSSKKARDIFSSSIGRVLFIDEAYRLATDLYLQQAADEIVQMLTEPKFLRKIVVILAGYERQIDNLMKLNPGLRSRFSTRIRFENFSNDTCCAILKQRLMKDGLELDEYASIKLPALMLKLSALTDFANGRDIDTWANRIYRTVASRRFDSSSASMRASVEDLEASLDALILDRSGVDNETE